MLCEVMRASYIQNMMIATGVLRWIVAVWKRKAYCDSYVFHSQNMNVCPRESRRRLDLPSVNCTRENYPKRDEKL